MLINSTDSLRLVAENLSKVASVKSLSTSDDDESWALTHDFENLESSCRTLIDDLFPKLLVANMPPTEREDLLTDIGEELRHIAYHIGSNKYYRYLGISTPNGDENS